MNNKALFGILVVVAAALIGLFALTNKGGTNSTSNNQVAVRPSPDGLPGLLTTKATWPANTDKLGDRLNSIGLPQLAAEGSVLHIHQHLDLFVNGKTVTVPAEIGIPASSNFISPIHVHDTTGVLHVESPTQQDYFLGQFFDIWGVKFDSKDLGGYRADAKHPLSVYINGQKYTGDPRALKLQAHQEIVVSYGTPPASIPTKFAFPSGE